MARHAGARHVGDLHEKDAALRKRIREAGKAAVAFSGGIDSMLLLTVAIDVLGTENVLAVIARSQFLTDAEFEEAVCYCEEIGASYKVVELNVLGDPDISSNPPDRCYLCKRNIFRGVIDAGEKQGVETFFEGSNLDDTGDYRPGMKAIRELGIESPLLDAGLTKQDVRDLARELGITAWDKPSSPCLATRFVFGETITQERLDMVEAAEQYLCELGFGQVRVRTHGEGAAVLARIEVGEDDFSKLEHPDIREAVFSKLKELGYAYVTFDALGYRRGSMNDL